MTLIVTDGKTIAADGQVTQSDGTVVEFDFPKIRLVGSTVYGFTGLATMIDVMIEWHQSGADPATCPQPKDGDDVAWNLIVFHSGHVWQYTHTSQGRGESMPAVWAWGIGRQFALGCVLCGKSAREAVEMAITHNTWLGGKITVLDAPAVAGEQIEPPPPLSSANDWRGWPCCIASSASLAGAGQNAAAMSARASGCRS